MPDPYVEIVALVTRKGMRGQGIGTILLAVAEKWALHFNIYQIRLYSNAIRENAHQFYYKNIKMVIRRAKTQ